MSHVDDGQLNALLDGELPSADARAVESHVATCADCRRRLEEARSFLKDANAMLDTLSPAAAQAPGVAPLGTAQAEEPARPSRSSVPVRPVGALADLPGGGAGGARPPAPPPQRPPMAPAASSPSAPPRKLAKTSREVAVEIDGRTALTPGISPVFTDDAEATGQRARPRRGFDFEKLAWAANIVLALGVGFLANEVRWMHSERQPSTAHVDTVLVSPPAPTQNATRAPVTAAPPQAAGPAARSDRGASGTPTTRAPRQIASGARSSRPTSGTPRRSSTALRKPPAAHGPKSAPAVTRSAPTTDLATRQPRAADALASAERQAPANAPAAALQNRADENLRASQGAGVSGGALAPATSRAQPASPTPAARSRQAAAAEPLPAVRPTPGFTRITMEEAVRTLSSSIRQIDGMTPLSIEAAGGRLIPGSDPSREVVRVNYTDQFGRRFTLDQQLAEPRAGRAFNGIIAGDTLVAPTTDGGSRVRWLDGKFWLSLSGPAPANEVRSLVGRVR